MDILIIIGLFILVIIVIIVEIMRSEKEIPTVSKTNKPDPGKVTNKPDPGKVTYRMIADDMKRAINSGKLVNIVYDKPEWDVSAKKYTYHTKTNRKIRPINVYSENKVLYLKAFCYLRNEERLFRISRINSYEIL